MEDSRKINGYLMSGDRKVTRIIDSEQDPDADPIDAPMPLFLRKYPFLTWLSNRAVCWYRSNGRILKKVLGLTDTSAIAAAMHVHGATITDNYWICQDGESLTYADVRFTADTFADIALTGSAESYSRQYTEKELRGNCPELTNIGSYEKCWRLQDGAWWMYKVGDREERFSEIFVAELGKNLGFPMAEYLPAGPYVKTPDFTHGRLNLELAEGLVGGYEDYAFNYDTFTSLNTNTGQGVPGHSLHGRPLLQHRPAHAKLRYSAGSGNR